MKSNYDDELIEELAALEHAQWMVWAKGVCDEVSEERRRQWIPRFVPYDDLPEREKERSRLWARCVLKKIEGLKR